MKARRLAVVAVASVITGGWIAGKVGLKGAKVAARVAIKTPGVTKSIVKSFASDVVTELKAEKTSSEVTERALVVVE